MNEICWYDLVCTVEKNNFFSLYPFHRMGQFTPEYPPKWTHRSDKRRPEMLKDAAYLLVFAQSRTAGLFWEVLWRKLWWKVSLFGELDRERVTVFNCVELILSGYQNTQEVKNDRFLVSTRQNDVHIFGIRYR